MLHNLQKKMSFLKYGTASITFSLRLCIYFSLFDPYIAYMWRQRATQRHTTDNFAEIYSALRQGKRHHFLFFYMFPCHIVFRTRYVSMAHVDTFFGGIDLRFHFLRFFNEVDRILAENLGRFNT